MDHISKKRVTKNGQKRTRIHKWNEKKRVLMKVIFRVICSIKCLHTKTKYTLMIMPAFTFRE